MFDSLYTLSLYTLLLWVWVFKSFSLCACVGHCIVLNLSPGRWRDFGWPGQASSRSIAVKALYDRLEKTQHRQRCHFLIQRLMWKYEQLCCISSLLLLCLMLCVVNSANLFLWKGQWHTDTALWIMTIAAHYIDSEHIMSLSYMNAIGECFQSKSTFFLLGEMDDSCFE